MEPVLNGESDRLKLAPLSRLAVLLLLLPVPLGMCDSASALQLGCSSDSVETCRQSSVERTDHGACLLAAASSTYVFLPRAPSTHNQTQAVHGLPRHGEVDQPPGTGRVSIAIVALWSAGRPS